MLIAKTDLKVPGRVSLPRNSAGVAHFTIQCLVHRADDIRQGIRCELDHGRRVHHLRRHAIVVASAHQNQVVFRNVGLLRTWRGSAKHTVAEQVIRMQKAEHTVRKESMRLRKSLC